MGFWGGAASPLPTSYGVWGSGSAVNSQLGLGRRHGRLKVFLHFRGARWPLLGLNFRYKSNWEGFCQFPRVQQRWTTGHKTVGNGILRQFNSGHETTGDPGCCTGCGGRLRWWSWRTARWLPRSGRRASRTGAPHPTRWSWAWSEATRSGCCCWTERHTFTATCTPRSPDSCSSRISNFVQLQPLARQPLYQRLMHISNVWDGNVFTKLLFCRFKHTEQLMM